ncbi:hypothetical protein BC628DRAFT_263461 [Trametes gibbosa]|nr:hypothetical protein BC628DRAFT_263461 [Trametes gibbosa]
MRSPPERAIVRPCGFPRARSDCMTHGTMTAGLEHWIDSGVGGVVAGCRPEFAAWWDRPRDVVDTRRCETMDVIIALERRCSKSTDDATHGTQLRSGLMFIQPFRLSLAHIEDCRHHTTFSSRKNSAAVQLGHGGSRPPLLDEEHGAYKSFVGSRMIDGLPRWALTAPVTKLERHVHSRTLTRSQLSRGIALFPMTGPRPRRCLRGQPGAWLWLPPQF